MTNRLSSILAARIGAKPVDNYGSTEPRPTTTPVEEIWSVEYCRKYPEQAAKAIKTLQMALDDVEGEIRQILEITGR
jgi:hypothetical protein